MNRSLERAERWLFTHEPPESSWRGAPKRFLRVTWLASRGFVRDEGFHHASALSFDTVLALVPLLVLVVGTLRGLNAYDAFVHTTIEPWIETTFFDTVGEGDIITLREAFLGILELGETADVRALGGVGLVALLYLVVILLTTVESTLNKVWGARRPRSLVRRAADYAAILFVLPLGLFLATTVGAALGDLAWLGPFRFAVSELVAVFAAGLVLTFLYLVMPHTRTRFVSALAGGLLAGGLWHVGLVLYASFQIGVARYNNLYSGFAAIPLFLVWIFVSWLIVLYGAEVAAAHQDERGFRWRVRDDDPSAHTRHQLGARFAAEITRAFARGEDPPTAVDLAEATGSPPRLAEEVLDTLVRHKLLLRGSRKGVPTYVLARDPRSIRLSAVLHCLDRDGAPLPHQPRTTDHRGLRLASRVAALERAGVEAPADLDLRALVDWLEHDDEAPASTEVERALAEGEEGATTEEEEGESVAAPEEDVEARRVNEA